MFVKQYYPNKRNQSNLDSFLKGFFSDFDASISKTASSGSFKNRPAVNILETDDNFQIELAAPGMSKENIKIDLNGDNLKISASKPTKSSDEQSKHYSLREFNFSNFERSFKLPESIDNQSINAKFENGVLLLTLAKKEEAKPIPPRTIAIL